MHSYLLFRSLRNAGILLSHPDPNHDHFARMIGHRLAYLPRLLKPENWGRLIEMPRCPDTTVTLPYLGWSKQIPSIP